MTGGSSWRKVRYELRPAKQVERRMLLSAFQGMSDVGYPIRNYQYTGMGSLYFVDFSLMYRYLGITNMLSVECDRDIESRVRFNAPYRLVRVEMREIGLEIPHLSADLRHILWMDYDFIMSSGMLRDVESAAYHLSKGSILLVTVDTDPPGKWLEPGSASITEQWMQHFVDEAGDLIDSGLEHSDFADSCLLELNSELLHSAILEGLNDRNDDLRYIPLFKFCYADGHRMLTIGGMIGDEADADRLSQLPQAEFPFLVRNVGGPCYEIRVPRVTNKERRHLDRFMPRVHGWSPEEFEMEDEMLDEYNAVHRFYPEYLEALL